MIAKQIMSGSYTVKAPVRRYAQGQNQEMERALPFRSRRERAKNIMDGAKHHYVTLKK
jgi:hypothetical protein